MTWTPFQVLGVIIWEPGLTNGYHIWSRELGRYSTAKFRSMFLESVFGPDIAVSRFSREIISIVYGFNFIRCV